MFGRFRERRAIAPIVAQKCQHIGHTIIGNAAFIQREIVEFCISHDPKLPLPAPLLHPVLAINYQASGTAK